MHDSWLFTGGCHLPYSCERYLTECRKCPILNSKRESDLSTKIFQLKKKVFDEISLQVVTPSNWLLFNSNKSALLQDKTIVKIPNPIETELYKPIDLNFSREVFRLPKNNKVIFFGVDSCSKSGDLNKGFQQISEAINLLCLDNVSLLIVGGSKPKDAIKFKYPSYYLGFLSDDVSIALAYNCADVVVVPSLSENLSNTIMEGLSCGVPVVAFNIGGNGDMIEHRKNGYLARPYDTVDLKNGISWVLESENYNDICQNARKKILKEFDHIAVSEQYINLYKNVLNV